MNLVSLTKNNSALNVLVADYVDCHFKLQNESKDEEVVRSQNEYLSSL